MYGIHFESVEKKRCLNAENIEECDLKAKWSHYLRPDENKIRAR